MVGRFAGEDFSSTSPLRVTRNESRFGLTSWRLEALDGKRKVVVDVDAPRERLVGVTYHDPDGDLAYCYNSEVASMHVRVGSATAASRRAGTCSTSSPPRAARTSSTRSARRFPAWLQVT